MDILVSFNNVYQFPGFPILGVINSTTLEVRIIGLPPEIPCTGALGLAKSGKYIYVGLQYAFDAGKSYRIPPQVGLEYNAEGILASLNPCSLLVFDRIDFRLLHQYYYTSVKDVHSFLLTSDEKILYVVSTGSDEIIRLEMDGSQVRNESVFWRPEPNGELYDRHHLNSICAWNGDIIVSGFGKKVVPDDWNSARNGFIYNISKRQMLMEGLQQPHSLAVIDDRLAFCESRNKCIRFVGEDGVIKVEGYSRGLCGVDDFIFCGTSARRAKSKSTGKLNKSTIDDNGGCTINKITVESREVIRVIDLKEVANEIYELLPVENVNNWPYVVPVDYNKKFQESWDLQREQALLEIKKYVPKNASLIIVDENIMGFEKHLFPEQTLFSFIEKDGVYWGAPENDDIAISELKRIQGLYPTSIIAFMWPAFWWLESYEKFHAFLRTNYKLILKNERIVLFGSQIHGL